MGSLKNPSAEEVRLEFAKRDFQRAFHLVEQGLALDPGQPDLVCEQAILFVYRAEEERAFELLPLCFKGYRFETLISLLADHYTSRILADRTDHDARRRLQLIRTFHPKESKHIGVKICACLIVRNEAKNLDRCLSSLAGKVDQIVVVDTGSTDETVSIAMRHGARVAEFQWCDDFAAARNYALSFATGNWILVIDADEELTPETQAALQRAVIRPQFGGFEIDIVNFMSASRHEEQFRHSPTRLFRNLPGVKFSGRIHEQINPSLVQLGLPWARLEGATILHYGYRPEEMEEKSKIERTMALLEREVEDNPDNSFQWFNLANVYLVANRPASAVEAAKSSIQTLGPQSGFAISTYCILIQALFATGELDEAIRYADEASQKGLDCLQIAFEKCNCLLAAGRFEEALHQSAHMMSLEWSKGATGDSGIFTHKRFVLRAQALAHFEKYEDAIDCLNSALEASPPYGPAHLVFGSILARLGKYGAAKEALQRSLNDPICFRGGMRELARIHSSLGELEEAAMMSHKIWKGDPSCLEDWLEWKSRCEATENPALTLTCYEELSAVQPLSAELLVDWGRTSAAAGRTPNAIKYFTEAINLDPTYANAYFNCGDLLFRTGMVEQAAQIYAAGLSLVPEHADGWFMLGNSLAHSGSEDEALKAFDKVLMLDPHHSKAQHNRNLLLAA
jgi:tetratricopeptide (TPR) repeat protein